METDLGRKTKEEATATTTAVVRAEIKAQLGPLSLARPAPAPVATVYRCGQRVQPRPRSDAGTTPLSGGRRTTRHY
ncbi:hypothetical protein DAPPUDRAFT_235046 [Daphnia pulex]|uniref:Uncharacterized protein n=1 Tax=Daphnia pulex TaxID=6669 RepID=E9FY38_DAPPU|nr:hypothetical protein DAPPUDRAFT_235046 [Daphnia pulex]|eukprot:EFX87467.1 hypothetical protein DAPPUDRAFT_235046 [Daphnia pulex]